MEMKKKFDALQMTRQIRDAHFEQTKNMTNEERLDFIRERGEKAQRELEELSHKLATRE
jgi:hypothetical protein